MPTGDSSLGTRVGQLFWIGFHGTSMSGPLRDLLSHVRPAGLILFARNIESGRQVRSLVDDLRRTLPMRPFVALDQEGGRVNRLKTILGPIPASHALASRSDAAKAVDRQARAMARTLRTLGFNVNLAPVLDLSGPGARNGIGDRSFGEDPLRVSRLARVFLEAHLKEGVIPVGKHFPGLGSARADTHMTLPVITKSRARLLREDLLPYRRLRRLLPIIMAGHACYPALQGKTRGPATLSKEVIEGLLRRRLGYGGVIVTDDLEMGAVEQERGAAAQALLALEAGHDGLMFCGSEEKIRAAYDGVLAAVRRRDVDPGRIDQCLERIASVRTRYLARRRPARFSTNVLERSRRSIAALGEPEVTGTDPTSRA